MPVECFGPELLGSRRCAMIAALVVEKLQIVVDPCDCRVRWLVRKTGPTHRAVDPQERVAVDVVAVAN